MGVIKIYNNKKIETAYISNVDVCFPRGLRKIQLDKSLAFFKQLLHEHYVLCHAVYTVRYCMLLLLLYRHTRARVTLVFIYIPVVFKKMFFRIPT